MIKILLISSFVLLFASCNSGLFLTKPISTNNNSVAKLDKNENKKLDSTVKISIDDKAANTKNSLALEYYSEYIDDAQNEMKRTGIPASITLAQAIVESNYGRSRLANKANNHFGIKCHASWTGGRIYHDDDAKDECFRKYDSAKESFRDHSDFLVNGERYFFLFELEPNDYKGWANGLKKAGYATNPKYPQMLINTIEENELYQYDKIDSLVNNKVGKKNRFKKADSADSLFAQSISEKRIVINNRISYITVKEGDTFSSLMKDFELLPREIYKYNNLADDAELEIGQLIYLQPKRTKAEYGTDYHILKEGETIYFISQKYGVKLRSLYEMNNYMMGKNPEIGDKILLR